MSVVKSIFRVSLMVPSTSGVIDEGIYDRLPVMKIKMRRNCEEAQFEHWTLQGELFKNVVCAARTAEIACLQCNLFQGADMALAYVDHNPFRIIRIFQDETLEMRPE